jgi:hypothetical protein
MDSGREKKILISKTIKSPRDQSASNLMGTERYFSLGMAVHLWN